VAPRREATIGDLDQPVEIKSETRTPDGQGGFTIAWTSVCEPWAAVAPAGASEQDRQGALRDVRGYEFRIHRRDGITAGMVVEWNGRRFNITGVTAPARRDPFMTIQAEEGVAT
jgi:SPP1 family predicted phage head-tail adaptor